MHIIVCSGLSSMHRNNPLYESQEISMDMFKEPDYDDEDEDDLDDDGIYGWLIG